MATFLLAAIASLLIQLADQARFDTMLTIVESLMVVGPGVFGGAVLFELLKGGDD